MGAFNNIGLGEGYRDEFYGVAWTPARCVPGIAKWRLFAGGTGAAEGKHAYQFALRGGDNWSGGVTYHIDPLTFRTGRHRGYLLRATSSSLAHGAPGLWADIDHEGNATSAGVKETIFRSPQSAAAAAKRHAQKLGLCQ